MEMKRVFHPIGQGAFYTETFIDGNNHFTIAYDCGSVTNFEINNLENEINSIGPIDILFVSHFHQDHINGVGILLRKNPKCKVILPVLTLAEEIELILSILKLRKENIDDEYLQEIRTLYWLENIENEKIRIIKSGNNNIVENYTDIKTIQGGITTNGFFSYGKEWEFVLYNPENQKAKALISVISTHLDIRVRQILQNDNRINDAAIITAFNIDEGKTLKQIYKSVFGNKSHNSYSMTLYSAPINSRGLVNNGVPYMCMCPSYNKIFQIQNACKNSLSYCMYTGDSEFYDKTNFKNFQTYYGNKYNNVGLVQIPHHGSKRNFNKNIGNISKCCIISVGTTNQYKHPSFSVISFLENNASSVFLVTEFLQTKVTFIYYI
jgi:beta-lactamase superfamily II metal-dependent hydrolase